MAVPHAVGSDAVLFAKVAGVLLTLATAAVLAWGGYATAQGRARGERILAAAFAPLLFLSFPYCAMHAVSGMETALAALLYALVTAVFLQPGEARWPKWLLPQCCFLLGVTRPEANLFCVVLLAIGILSSPGRARGAPIVRGAFCYLLPGAAYFAWRYAYYGLLLPLPFYVKSGRFGLTGLGPACEFLRDVGLGLTLPLLAFLGLPPRRHRAVLAAIGAMSRLLSHGRSHHGRWRPLFLPPAVRVGPVGRHGHWPVCGDLWAEAGGLAEDGHAGRRGRCRGTGFPG